MNVHIIAYWAIVIAGFSVAYDLSTYSARQTKWEQLHPGATYMRNYRTMQKKGLVD